MDDLKLIKKHYGEKMSHLCRDLFPTILETEGLLWKILTSKFAYNKILYEDFELFNATNDFKELIYSEYNPEKEEVKEKITKTPQELLDEAGYDFYECNSEDDIQQFRKYYYKDKDDLKNQYINSNELPSYIGEELCTFGGKRLDRCHVFFAVKKNVDEIKRENFDKPNRQDEYGTSVISIQFTRDSSHILSIKNRYNHTVNNPDSTFSNNLDNIIPGLTEAFKNTYGLFSNKNNKQDFFVPPSYVEATNGKYYKYNLEKDNIYYCINNVILDHFNAHELDKSKYIVMENYILNLQTKKIYSSYDEYLKSTHIPEYGSKDSFINSIGEINDIKINYDRKTQNKTVIINGNIEILLDNHNRIIKYKNENVKKIESNFLENNYHLNQIELPNVEIIEDNFLPKNDYIKTIDLPNLKEIGSYFLKKNTTIESINLPNVKSISDDFLPNLSKIEYISLPKVEIIKDNFLARGYIVRNIDIPNIKHIGNSFLFYNEFLKEDLHLPKLETIGDNFLFCNTSINSIDLPKTKIIGNRFIEKNDNIESINLPNVIKIGDSFLEKNTYLDTIFLPNVKTIGTNFINNNKTIKKIEMPQLEELGDNFLGGSSWLNILKMPNLTTSYRYDTIYNLTTFLNNCLLLQEIELNEEIINKLKTEGLKEEIIELLDKNKAK